MNNKIEKIFYLNDERGDMTVRIMDKKYDGVTCTGDTYVTLGPAEGRLFELLIPEDCCLYVKKWWNLVMISYTYPVDLAQSTGSPPRAGGG